MNMQTKSPGIPTVIIATALLISAALPALAQINVPSRPRSIFVVRAPDLIVESFDWERLNGGVKLLVTVRNQGNGPAGPSTLYVWGGDVARGPTPALAPGQSAVVKLVADFWWGYLDFYADCAGQVRESDERNNWMGGSLELAEDLPGR